MDKGMAVFPVFMDYHDSHEPKLVRIYRTQEAAMQRCKELRAKAEDRRSRGDASAGDPYWEGWLVTDDD